MISVAIMINSIPIMARSAVNSGRIDHKTGEVEYEIDDGKILLHNPDRGAVELAIKMLKTIKCGEK